MTLKQISTMVGAGLAAGILGTAAITASSTIEARLRGREDSKTPGKMGSKLLHVKPTDKEGQKRLSMAMHWEYGINWGFMLPVLDLIGIRGVWPAAIAQFVAVWATELVVLPNAKVSPPITEWPPEEIAIDMLHHAIYSLSASAAYAAFRGDTARTMDDFEGDLEAELDFDVEKLPELVY